MKVIRIESYLVVCGLILVSFVGCSTLGGKLSDSDGRFNLMKGLKLKKNQEPEFETPKSMVGIWRTSTFEKAGSPSVRGFGGRFYFYGATEQPVRVNGDLTIYGYDDQKQAESGDGKADRKFVFKAESLNSHYSESAMGSSYSFFVPWDNVGGEEKTITLIPVFKTVDGHMPEAKSATMRLPGKRVSKPANPVVQASAESEVTASAATKIATPIPKKKRAHRMASTFRLTPNLKQTLSSPPRRTTSVATSRPEGRLAIKAAEKPSGNTEKLSSTSKSADETEKQSPFVGRVDTSNTQTRVFGKPGAFR